MGMVSMCKRSGREGAYERACACAIEAKAERAAAREGTRTIILVTGSMTPIYSNFGVSFAGLFRSVLCS